MKFLPIFSEFGNLKSLVKYQQYRFVRGSRKLAEQPSSSSSADEQRDDFAESSDDEIAYSGKKRFFKSAAFNPSADQRSSVEDFVKNPANSSHLKRLLEESSGKYVDLEDVRIPKPKVAWELKPKKGAKPPEAPYPTYGSNPEKFIKLDQTRYSFRPASMQARETSIIVFPGQGSQYVGMAKKLQNFPNVKELFAKANEILKYDLLSMCLNGSKDELNKTIHSQPAIFVCSLAAVEKLKYQKPDAVGNCIATAGFSVGEYAALVLAGSLTFEDALRLVKVRAEAMQAASELEPSGLMTIVYKSKEELNSALEAALEWATSHAHIEDPVCTVANYLFTRCKVIGGHDEALKFIENNARKYGIRMCKRLEVSGAFHTRLMKPAVGAMKSEVSKLKVEKPQLAIYSNADGLPYIYPHKIQRWLVEQIYSPIFWDLTMKEIYKDESFGPLPRTYECGPGKQLGAMLKQYNSKASELYCNVIDEDLKQ